MAVSRRAVASASHAALHHGWSCRPARRHSAAAVTSAPGGETLRMSLCSVAERAITSRAARRLIDRHEHGLGAGPPRTNTGDRQHNWRRPKEPDATQQLGSHILSGPDWQSHMEPAPSRARAPGANGAGAASRWHKRRGERRFVPRSARLSDFATLANQRCLLRHRPTCGVLQNSRASTGHGRPTGWVRCAA